MTESRRLLAFGPPTISRIPARSAGFSPPPHRPKADRQGVRLSPQFSALQAALLSRRVEAAASTSEPDPELVAVFDLAGTVDDFMRAIGRINGLEFLVELDEDMVEPDENFYYEKDGAITEAFRS